MRMWFFCSSVNRKQRTTFVRRCWTANQSTGQMVVGIVFVLGEWHESCDDDWLWHSWCDTRPFRSFDILRHTANQVSYDKNWRKYKFTWLRRFSSECRSTAIPSSATSPTVLWRFTLSSHIMWHFPAISRCSSICVCIWRRCAKTLPMSISESIDWPCKNVPMDWNWNDVWLKQSTSRRTSISKWRSVILRARIIVLQFSVRLFQQMKSVVKGMLFILQLTSAGMIACAIFLVDGASQQFDTNFVIMVVVLIVSLVTIFPCCYFASRITAKLDQSAQIIYFSMWYLVPFNERKQFPFVIAFAQRDHSIRMMNMFSCSLESFVQVNGYETISWTNWYWFSILNFSPSLG